MVHIRHCSAGICQQEWVVAKWLGLSVTVGVGARARGWNPSFIFLFCLCDRHHFVVPAACIVDVKRHMTSSGMKRKVPRTGTRRP